MLAALREALAGAAADPAVRVVVMRRHRQGFLRRARPARDAQKAAARLLPVACSPSATASCAIRTLPQPVIARVQGVATAGVASWWPPCDLAVAAETARLASRASTSACSAQPRRCPLSRNVGPKRAFEMLFTGEFIDAATARERELVESRRGRRPARRRDRGATASISPSPPPCGGGQGVVLPPAGDGHRRAYQLAVQAMAANVMDADGAGGVEAFLEKRTPRWAAGE